MCRVSVVIVNFNGKKYLSRVLEALKVQTFDDFEVLLVDNASTDGSIESLENIAANIRVLRQRKNIGFAAANNLAAGQAQGEWIATLNPDAVAEPDWLDRLMEAVDSYPDAALFGSTQIDYETPSIFDGSGDAYHAFGVMWRKRNGRPFLELPDDTTVFGPCAAAALYRRETFRELGGFDEDFFCYCEDVDLAFRFLLAGHTAVQVGKAVVYHVGSGVTGRRSYFSVYHGYRNRIWTFVKNMPGAMFWILLPAHIVMTAVLLFVAFVRGTFKPAWMGVVDSLKGICGPWHQRKIIQSRRRASYLQLARMMDWSLLSMIRRA